VSAPRIGGETEFHGPRRGDRVAIEVRGVVARHETRDGVEGVRVTVPGTYTDAWRPLDEVVIVERATDGHVDR
jgi:hypothetical protein